MSSTQSQPNFHVFPGLPAELRVRIWQLSCTPRLVTMVWNPQTEKFEPRNAPPAILHVNRESRHEAMKLYEQLILASDPPYVWSTTTATFFSPSLDTLYFPRQVAVGSYINMYNMPAHLPNASSLLRRLAMDYVTPAEIRPWELYGMFCMLKDFRELEEAYLVVSETMSGPDRQAVDAGEEFRLVDPDGDNLDAIRSLMDRLMGAFAYELPNVVSVNEEDTAEEEGEGENGSGRGRVAPWESKYTWKVSVPPIPKVRLTIRY